MALDTGLSTVLVQFDAREFVGLSRSGGEKAEEAAAPSLFLTLARISRRWYGMAAVIFLLIYPAGVDFLDQWSWRPWLRLARPLGAPGLRYRCWFRISSCVALTEGSGSVADVNAVRLVQGLICAVAAWAVLAMGGGLYAIAMVPAASVLFMT